MFPFDLRYKRFIGIVLNPELKEAKETKLTKTKSGAKRYKVHIPELMPFIKEDEGIWCFNSLFTTTKIITPQGNIEEITGDNLSIKDGTQHFIRFIENDVNSGRILEPTGNK
jgi:hypothetical protein